MRIMAQSKPLKHPPTLAAVPSDNWLHEKLIPALLIALVIVVMWPLLLGDFTSWDDYRAIVANAWLNPPTLQKVAEFWNPKHPYMDIWIPLTYTLWSAVAAVSYVSTPDPETGAHLNSWTFHGANLAVHVVSVLVVYAILKRVTGKSWPAAAGAALFAIHPVQIEPVGWISGMKDVLAGCLGLISVWQYLLFASNNNCTIVDARLGETSAPRSSEMKCAAAASTRSSSALAHYAIATIAFILAMLAKPSAVVVPLVVFALDRFLSRRPIRSTALALLPWFLLVIPIIFEGRIAQPAPRTQAIAIGLRPLIAADALAFYLYKLFFPLRLGIIYDHTPQAALAYHWAYFTWIAPVVVAAALWIFRRRFSWLIAAVAVFWLAVLPVLGLVPFDFQAYSTVADHYLYLAMLGPALALAMALLNIRKRGAIVAIATILLLLAGRAFIQTWTWRDSISLFSHAVAVNPHACGTYNNLAEAYRSKHDYATALAIFEKGVSLNPDCVPLRIGYASTLATVDRPQEARQQYGIAAKTATGDDAVLVQRGLAQLDKSTHGR